MELMKLPNDSNYMNHSKSVHKIIIEDMITNVVNENDNTVDEMMDIVNESIEELYITIDLMKLSPEDADILIDMRAKSILHPIKY